MNEQEVEKLAVTLMAKHGLLSKGWDFGFDKATRRAGCCHWNRRKITLSKYLSTHAPDPSIVKNTILHEIAHALCGANENHGRVWRRKFMEIGGNGQRCSSGYSYEAPKWKATCPGCNMVSHYRRRAKVACRTCCVRHNNNKFTEKYLLVFTENKPKPAVMKNVTISINGGEPIKANQVELSFA